MPHRDSRERAPTRDPVYRLITGLMAADIVVGLAVAGVGELGLGQRGVTLAGLGLALIGALVLFLFQRLGARADRRHDSR